MNAIVSRAAFTPSTYDAESNTVQAVISTFADVPRREGKVSFIERLDPEGLDTSKLAGSPVLNAHRQGDARDVIGVIESVRREGGALIATIRLSTAADAAPVVQRVREGTLRGVSVGYRVSKWGESSSEGRRVRTALQWSIHEVSLVPIPADPEAQIRGAAAMEGETEDTITAMPEADQARIRSIGELADLPPSFAESQIAAGATIEEARTAARTEMQRRSEPVSRIRVVSPAADDPAVVLERRIEALAVRAGAVAAPSDEARPYVGDRLIDHARAAVERAGISTRTMDQDQIFRAAMHSTSDFPTLLTGVGNRTLMPAYQAAESPLKRIARQATASDFRPQSRLRISGTGTLEKVSESGEIKSTTRGESVESYSIDSFASIFALTRKALINDDLGAFRDWGNAAGRAAAQTEGNLIWAALTANNNRGLKLSDNKALFHADHKNLKAVAGQGFKDTGADALSDAKMLIARQTDLDGRTPINARGKFILVSPENEDDALKLLAAIYPPTVADVNPNTGRFDVLTDPRVTSNDLWMFADPASLPVIEYAYLASAPGPQLSSREGWDVLGTEWRVVLDFGVGAVDHRGAALVADV